MDNDAKMSSLSVKGDVCVSSHLTGPLSPVSEHLHTVTPRLVVSDGAAAIDVYRQAFAAELTADVEDGAPARSPEALGGLVSAIMATYWENVDVVWERAVDAGAEVIYPLQDQFYGERGGRLRDLSGHQWMLSQRIERLSDDEMKRRAAGCFASS
jgi:PhnB protein